MARHRVLVVDNERGMLEVCGDILKKLPDVEVVLQPDSLKAAQLLEAESWDLLITDLRMPGLSGIDLLKQAHKIDPSMEALTITAFPTVDTAVESMKLGASDYITKPFHPDELLETVRRILGSKRISEEHRLLRRQIERPYAFGEMLGRSSAMLTVFDTIERVAKTDADVLITGPTGTGKELVARSIHSNSTRSEERFVPVDCGAIPDELLESEFFGHERGAFTGAVERSLGLLEFAHRGTFFLDEIGELSTRLQAKLLRALQERKIRRVGGNSEIEVDVRIVAASARDLEKEIEENRFRSDLYYRINVVRIELPPLRDRSADIPLLIEHFLDRFGKEMNLEGAGIADDALEVLTGYSWPGNVRELQNAIKRMLISAGGETISIDNVPDPIVAHAGESPGPAGSGFFELRKEEVERFERAFLHKLMVNHKGDVAAGAEQAGVPRGTLYRLLNKYDLNPADFRE